MTTSIKLGISSCLLGNNVRYDNSNKWDRFITDTLGQFVEYLPVCPEVECGLGIPREPVRQVGNPLSPRLLTTRTKIDHTDRMISWAKKRVRELEKEDLCGFIFKSGSPSSGMERIKVFPEKPGMPTKKGVGIFARIFMEHFPRLPVEEDGRLHDVNLRENFIERIFTLRRWRDLRAHHAARQTGYGVRPPRGEINMMKRNLCSNGARLWIALMLFIVLAVSHAPGARPDSTYKEICFSITVTDERHEKRIMIPTNSTVPVDFKSEITLYGRIQRKAHNGLTFTTFNDSLRFTNYTPLPMTSFMSLDTVYYSAESGAADIVQNFVAGQYTYKVHSHLA